MVRSMADVLHTFAQALPDTSSAGATGAPDWLHLVPAGTFSGIDGRGPFELGNAEAVIAASMPAGLKLPIDENHAIDHVGSKGGASPARAWVVELQARPDGIWGRVEWTGEGKRLMEDRAYGFISPALLTTKAKPHRVVKLLRASLVNDPNLSELKSLHLQSPFAEDTDMEEELRQALGLPASADRPAIVAAVTTLHSASTAQATLMARLAEAAGAKKDASVDELVVAIHARGQTDEASKEVAALKEEAKSLHSQLTQLTVATAKANAEGAIGAAIAGGKLVPALKDHFIARHMKDPAEVEKELALMPSLNAGGLKGYRPSAATGADGQTLSAEDAEVCALMGIDPVKFAETSKALQKGAY